MSERSEKKSFIRGSIVGVLIGAVAGAIGGVLFAPQSGKQTREQLADGLKNAGTELEQKATLLNDKIQDFSGTTGKDIMTLAKRAVDLKNDITSFSKDFAKDGVLTDELREQAQRMIDESQKILADLDRLIQKNESEGEIVDVTPKKGKDNGKI